MPAIARKTASIFGASLTPSSNLAVWGSTLAGTPTYSGDPNVLQSAAWLQGLGDSVIGNRSPVLEELNGLLFSLSWQIAYALERGIPEWDSSGNTNYYQYDFCRIGLTVYVCTAAGPISSNPSTDTNNWVPYQNTFAGPNIAKAWIVFSGSTPTILSSSNIGSINQNSTGNYTVTFSNPIGLNPCISGNCSGLVRPISNTVVSSQTTAVTFDTAGLIGGLFQPTQYPYVSLNFFST